MPSVFVKLDKLPLSAHGKIDRQALPAPDSLRPELEQEYRAPVTVVEEVLAGIWSDLLRVEHVGIEDSFFELGGHSLLATQCISRIRRAYSIELPLRDLFETPTIRGLAAGRLKGCGRRGRCTRAYSHERGSGRARGQCRMPNGGCGSSTSYCPARRSTTLPSHCGWKVS